MHLIEAVGNLLEALAQALLERGLQLLVDGRAHLFETLAVVGLDRRQLVLHRLAHLGDPLVVAVGQRAQLLGLGLTEAVQRRVLRLARSLRLRGQRVRGRGQRVADHLLHRRQLGAERIDLLVLRACDVARLRQQRLLERGQRLRQLAARAARAVLHVGAQVAFEPIGGVGVAATQREPEQQHHHQAQQHELGDRDP